VAGLLDLYELPESFETVRPSVCEAEATVVMSVGESVSEVDLEAS
jgi:hypothetical protein